MGMLIQFLVHWKLTGKDENENTATSYGTIALDTSDLSNFIPFSDLTASKVQGWVETALNKMHKNEVQNQKRFYCFGYRKYDKSAFSN